MNKEKFTYFIPRANHFFHGSKIYLEVARGRILGDL